MSNYRQVRLTIDDMRWLLMLARSDYDKTSNNHERKEKERVIERLANGIWYIERDQAGEL